MAHTLGESEFWLPSNTDEECIESVAHYWQLADDASDASMDIGENKPKALFLLREMASIAEGIMNGSPQTLFESAWYRLIQKASPGKIPSLEEIFCCRPDELPSVMQKRMQQFSHAHGIIKRSNEQLTTDAKQELMKVISTIDFRSTILDLAREFGRSGLFPSGGFGSFMRPMYVARIEKISRQHG